MVFPVGQPTLSTDKENKELKLLLCQIIQNRNFEDFKRLLNSGLDSNCRLSNKVRLGNDVYEQGCSLLYLIVHSSLTSLYSWDQHILLEILLEK